MLEAEQPTFAMLEECVAYDSDEVWAPLLQSLRGMVRTEFRRGHCPGGSEELFVGWFFGWFRIKQKHVRAYLKVQSANHPNDAERDKHAVKYLWRVAKTGLVEYVRENRVATRGVPDDYPILKPPAVEDPNPLLPPGTDPPCLAAVEERLPGLAQAKRVPFLLRHYAVFGMPPDEDIDWIARRCNLTPGEVRECIGREAGLHPKSSRPVSADFIAQLLGLTRNAVYQRVRRAWLDLLELMGVSQPDLLTDPFDETD